ncbi:MAG: adenine deaminase [Dehalococcoidia bacterium]|nr:MAG: adenine deaminase [Dehalococcoidia bacterium]
MPHNADLIRVARGELPADLVVRNARTVNTLTGTIDEGDVAVYEGFVAGVGRYDEAREYVDLEGAFLLPGLIDGHTHIESSMLHPARYAEAVVPRGTLTVVTDLHEIANVCGIEGVEFAIRWSHRVPLDMKFMAPSCVPSSPLETSGADLGPSAIRQLLARPEVIGLGEVMNYPGVLSGAPDVMDKIEAAHGKPIDGHAPGLRGRELNAYLAAGIMSDHECTTRDEAEEKLHKGMYLMVREGSSEKNLEALLPAITDGTFNRCMFVVDDRSAADLAREGDIDHVVRKAISLGMDPIRAIQLATLNPALYFRLFDRGSVSPGKVAHLLSVPDLHKFEVDRVYHRGKLVAQGGVPLFNPPPTTRELTGTIRFARLSEESLRIPGTWDTFPVVELVPGQIVTRKRMLSPRTRDGAFVSDTARDILKLVVVERHRGTGNVGKGFVMGFGLRQGALASSIGHDSHNIICVGVTDEDILGAIQTLQRVEGGLVVFADGEARATLPLPIAGLLSPEPLDRVVAAQKQVEEAARQLGVLPQSPFSLLSFLALPVIPELRVTDLGVVDVAEFRVIA